MTTRTFILILFTLCASRAYSQSKKEVIKLGIKTSHVSETEGNKTIDLSDISYTKKGEILEETTYDKEGKVKTIHRYQYNKAGQIAMEDEVDENAKLKERRFVKYNNFGEKIEEIFYGGDLKLIRRHTYTYDKFSLKTERKTFDAAGNMTEIKKYSYTF